MLRRAASIWHVLPRDLRIFWICFSVWIAVNLVYGTIPLVASWVFLQPYTAGNSVMPVSIAWSSATFLLALYRLRIDPLPRVVLAMTAPFAFLATFEVLYQHLFLLVRPTLFRTDLQGEVLLGSWVVLGLTSLAFWRPTKKTFVTLTLLAVSFSIWLLMGYPQIFEVGSSSTSPAFVLNAVTKSLTAVLFLTLLYDGTNSLSQGKRAGMGNILYSSSYRLWRPHVQDGSEEV